MCYYMSYPHYLTQRFYTSRGGLPPRRINLKRPVGNSFIFPEDEFVYRNGDCVGYRYHNIIYKQKTYKSSIVEPKPKVRAKRAPIPKVKQSSRWCRRPTVEEFFAEASKAPPTEAFNDPIEKDFVENLLQVLRKARTNKLTHEESWPGLYEATKKVLLSGDDKTLAIIEVTRRGRKYYKCEVRGVGDADENMHSVVEYPVPRLGCPVRRYRLIPACWGKFNAELREARAAEVRRILSLTPREDRVEFDLGQLHEFIQENARGHLVPFDDPFLAMSFPQDKDWYTPLFLVGSTTR